MIPDDTETPLSWAHQRDLQRAFGLLERQNFAARLADYAGQPIDRVLSMMPEQASAGLNRAIEAAMLRCLELAISSIETKEKRRTLAGHFSSLLVGLNGGISGFFGLVALPIELPVTTMLMLRAIADTARHQGEDLSQLEARLACVEVFALGARNSGQRLGYFASRALLSKLAGEASVYLAERGVARASAPVVNRLLAEIASRFGVVVSERFAASAVPVLGAVGGATVNFVFMNHFQRVAHGHFTIRRLERVYGSAAVRRHYETLVAQSAHAGRDFAGASSRLTGCGPFYIAKRGVGDNQSHHPSRSACDGSDRFKFPAAGRYRLAGGRVGQRPRR